MSEERKLPAPWNSLPPEVCLSQYTFRNKIQRRRRPRSLNDTPVLHSQNNDDVLKLGSKRTEHVTKLEEECGV